MIEDEIEIGSFHTGLSIDEGFFENEKYFTEDDLYPVIYNLLDKCKGLIKDPGIYAFRLHVSKLK